MAGSEPQTILSGMNPLHVNPSNPITLFIFQLVLIVCLCRVIHIGLKYLNQPRVISEIIAGILLGPTVLGRIDSFNKTAFPQASIPYLNLVANLGLILFLFIIGLELDPRSLKKNLKKSLAISLVGIIVPFCVGIVVSFLFYAVFQKTGTRYVFMLFIGVALSITAFPVLARVLSELRMIKTTVGQTVITAASIDDVVAWCLLALVVALSKNASGLTAMYILLTGIGYVLFVFFAVKPLYLRFLTKKGFLAGRDPSPQIVFITFLLVFISAWFTDALGIHAIFGAYVIGVIVPHQGRFAIKLTEKIEDIVSIFFLPIYFALSGLKTNLAVLNSYKAWLLLILAVCVDMFGKIVGCGSAARYCKFSLRESLTIGVLMSCKGLVELIVLNVGLEAGVINTSVFSVLVLSALITTFLTTPIVRKLYPPKYHKMPEDEPNDLATIKDTKPASEYYKAARAEAQHSAVISVNRITQLPSLLALLSLLNTPQRKKKAHSSNNKTPSARNFSHKLHLFVLRLVELTGRGSSVMRSAESQDMQKYDSILTTLGAYFQISDISSSLHLSVCNTDLFAEKILDHAESREVSLAIVSAFEKITTLNAIDNENMTIIDNFNNGNSYKTGQEADMIARMFSDAKINVAVFISRGLSSVNFSRESLDFSQFKSSQAEFEGGKCAFDSTTSENDKHTESKCDEKAMFLEGIDVDLPIVFVPFFGGIDDGYSLKLVLDLIGNSDINIQVVYYIRSSLDSKSSKNLSNAYLGDAFSSPGQENIPIPQSAKLSSNRLNLLSDRQNTFISESLSVFTSEPLVREKNFGFLADILGLDMSSLPEFNTSSLDGPTPQKSESSSHIEAEDLPKNKNVATNENAKTNWKLFKDRSDKVQKSKNQKDLPSPDNQASANSGNASKGSKKNKEKHHKVEGVETEVAQSALHLKNFVQNLESDIRPNISFVCPKYKNVSLKVMKSQAPLTTSIKHINALRQCDIVVCGRNAKHGSLSTMGASDLADFNAQSVRANHDPTQITRTITHGDLLRSDGPPKAENKNILGPLAQKLLDSNCRASLLVVQSYSILLQQSHSFAEQSKSLKQV